MRRSTSRRGGQSFLGLPEIVIKTIVLLLLLASWEVFSHTSYLKVYKFSRPSMLIGALWELMTVGYPKGLTVWLHIKATVLRILMGYFVAICIAIPTGLIVGRSYLLNRAINPIVTFARSIAVISLLPLAIAWFGIGETSRVILVCYGCFWVILTNTIEGVRQLDVNHINAGRLLGATNRQIFFRIALPATLPRIFAGMKIALGVAFMVIVAVEMIGTVKGLGALIMQAKDYYDIPMTMDGMIFIAVFGLLISLVLDWVERLLLPWAAGLEEVKR
ncbi:MAG: ABC transporter permease subunit [candidate division Zixibacteria bacterium]|nr:ABC transporter permease subunit [candidate division Zixibacteria bacterium]